MEMIQNRLNALVKLFELITEETINEQERTIKAGVEGFELDRYDCSSPNYHLRNGNSEKLLEQYTIFQSDPRRI